MNFDIKYLEETLLLIIEEVLETNSEELAPVRDSVVRVKKNRTEQFDHLAAIYYIKDKDLAFGLSDDLLDDVDYAKIVYDTIVKKINVKSNKNKYKDSYAKKETKPKSVQNSRKSATEFLGVVEPPKIDKYAKEKDFNNRVINLIGNDLIRLTLKRKNAHRAGANTSDGNKVLSRDLEEYELLLQIRDLINRANYSSDKLIAVGNLAYVKSEDVDSLIKLASGTFFFRDKEIPEQKKDIVTRELLKKNKELIRELVRYIDKVALKAGKYDNDVKWSKTITIDDKSWIVPSYEVLECNKIIKLVLMLREQNDDLVDVWGVAGCNKDNIIEFKQVISEIKYMGDKIPKISQNESKITDIKAEMLALINRAANDDGIMIASNGLVLESDYERYQLLDEQLGYLVKAISSLKTVEVAGVLVDEANGLRYEEIQDELNKLDNVQKVDTINYELNKQMLNVIINDIEDLNNYKKYILNRGLVFDDEEKLNLLGVLAKCLLSAQNSTNLVQVGNILVDKNDEEEVICVIKRLAVKHVVKSYLSDKDDLAPIYDELLSYYQKQPVIDVPFREIEGIEEDLNLHGEETVESPSRIKDERPSLMNNDNSIVMPKDEVLKNDRGGVVRNNLEAIREIKIEISSMLEINYQNPLGYTSDKRIVEAVNLERYERLKAKLSILENAREFDDDLIDIGGLKIKIKDLRFYNAIDAKLTENKLVVMEKKKPKRKFKKMLPLACGVGVALATVILFNTLHTDDNKDRLDNEYKKYLLEDVDIQAYNKFNKMMQSSEIIKRTTWRCPAPTEQLSSWVNDGMRREKINVIDIYGEDLKDLQERERQKIAEEREREEAELRKALEREREEKLLAQRREEELKALEEQRTQELIAVANLGPKKDVDSALNKIVNMTPRYSDLLNLDFYSLGLDDKIQFVLGKYNISYSDFNDICYGYKASDYASELKEYREAINAEMLKVILEREGLSANQFDVVQAVTQAETSVSYEDTYWTINSIDNRLNSKQWTNNGTAYLSLYAQVTRSGQYEVYFTKDSRRSYTRYLGVTNTINYQAVIDYCYFKKSVMNYMSFRSWGSSGYSDIYVTRRGNRYAAELTLEGRRDNGYTR